MPKILLMRTTTIKSAGQSIAEQHGSAVGQTSAKIAYQKLAEGSSRKPSPFGSEHAKKARARAVRVGLDRLRRLGERYRENFRVAPRDSALMKKELSILKEQIKKVADRDNDNIALLDTQSAFSLAQNRGSLDALLNQIFQGKVKPADELASTGDLKDQDADPLIINFSGRLNLTPSTPQGARGAQDMLTNTTSTNMLVPQDLPGAKAGEEGWVDQAIERVGDSIKQDSQSAIDAQTKDKTFDSAALLYK